jgi:hypothetical protein
MKDDESFRAAVAFLETAIGPRTKWTVSDAVAVCNEARERAERAEAEVKRLREALHSALGYLSAEDNPQARRICQGAALVLDGCREPTV